MSKTRTNYNRIYTFTCKYCGEPFNSNFYVRKKERFCNLKCTTEYIKINGKLCLQCNGRFIATSNSHILCSKQCRLEYTNNHRKESEHQKNDFLIFARDNFTCIYCGKSSLTDGVKLEAEHIYPIAEGGSGRIFNLITSCAECNGGKKTAVLSENIILRLWEIAEERNKKLFMTKTYKQLEKHFMGIADKRKDRLR